MENGKYFKTEKHAQNVEKLKETFILILVHLSPALTKIAMVTFCMFKIALIHCSLSLPPYHIQML